MNAGKAQVTAVIERARERRGSGRRTVLFLDEIHRFNKAQQDALLPAVEEGLVTLIGATTENPYFEVNSALLSRCQIYELRELGAGDVEALLRRALSDPERGIADPPEIADDALELLAHRSGGDARAALGALERAGGDGARQRRGDRPRDGRGRAPAEGDRLRPPGRQALRLHLGADQGDARLGPRRVHLLPRGDARGRGGPALHRPADGDLRLGGHRQRRPASARGRDRGRRGGRPGRAARVRAQPGAGRGLSGARAEVERLDHGDLVGDAPRPRARREAAARRAARLPLSGRQEAGPRPGLRLPARPSRAASRTSRSFPPRSAAPASTSRPTEASRKRMRKRLEELRNLRGDA